MRETWSLITLIGWSMTMMFLTMSLLLVTSDHIHHVDAIATLPDRCHRPQRFAATNSGMNDASSVASRRGRLWQHRQEELSWNNQISYSCRFSSAKFTNDGNDGGGRQQ
jgi:hypothetical protein